MNPFNALPAGHRIADRYVVERKIGQGRSSAVYSAQDERTASTVALKILDPFLACDEVSVERFRREVAIIRGLDHPNIIRIYDFFRDAELHVICMERVDGVDAATYLRERGPLPVAQLLELAPRMLSAVEACHREMVLHRDIKPQNILVDRHGEIRLVDFGISKVNTMSDLTRTGTAMGSPEYMAPELFRSTRADPRSDVYALGAVLYELLSGHPPYPGDSLARIMTLQLEGEIEPLAQQRDDVPAWLESILMKCLRTDPNRRYQSVAEIVTEFTRSEHALCVYEEKNEAAICLGCRAEQIPGLDFCWDCGQLADDALEPGEYSIVVYKADAPELLAARIAEIFPGTDTSRSRRRLGRGCTLICRGISEKSAGHLYNELASLFCEISSVRSLPRELRMPSWLAFAALGVFALFYATLGKYVSLYAGDVRPPLIAGLAIATSQAAIFGFYRFRTRPLVSVGRAASGQASSPGDRTLAFLGAIREVRLRDVRRLLGHVAANFLGLLESRGAEARLDAAELTTLAHSCFRAATQLEGYEVYLESRSLMGIKDRLDVVKTKLEHSRDAADIETLAGTETELEQELRAFQDAQELHSRTYVSLLNANGALEKLRNALQCGDSCPELGAEIRALRDRLEAGCESPLASTPNPEGDRP